MSTKTVEKGVILMVKLVLNSFLIKVLNPFTNSRYFVKCKVEKILRISEHPTVPLHECGPLAASAARWAARADPASYSGRHSTSWPPVRGHHSVLIYGCDKPYNLASRTKND